MDRDFIIPMLCGVRLPQFHCSSSLVRELPFVCFSQDAPSDIAIRSAASAKFAIMTRAERRLPVILRGVVTAVPEGWKGFSS